MNLGCSRFEWYGFYLRWILSVDLGSMCLLGFWARCFVGLAVAWFWICRWFVLFCNLCADSLSL